MQDSPNTFESPIPHLRNGAFLFLFLLSSLCSVGQEAERGRFRGNVLLGISTSQISGDDLGGFNKLGLWAGAGVRIAIEEKWEIGMDITYVNKGSRDLVDFEKNDFDSYLLRLDYAEVPIYAHYTQDKWEFDVGLAVAYLLSSLEEDENGEVVGLGREFKTIDLSGLLGMSYPLGDRFRLSIRGYQSVLPVRDNSLGATFRLNKGQYNSVLMFGIRFFPGQ